MNLQTIIIKLEEVLDVSCKNNANHLVINTNLNPAGCTDEAIKAPHGSEKQISAEDGVLPYLNSLVDRLATQAIISSHHINTTVDFVCGDTKLRAGDNASDYKHQ